MTPVIIAEIGSSPAPAWNFALWCWAAQQAGATHVKAQMFRAEHFPPEEQDSKRPLEFPRQRLQEFVDMAHRVGLKAGVSVFDEEAVELAAQHCDFIKRAARERWNRELIGQINRAIAGRKIESYYSVSSWGYDIVWPDKSIPLFAVQRYPTQMIIAVWRVIRAPRVMRTVNAWGWSSHTRGALDCKLAARLGASVIEKHLCIDDSDIEAGHSLWIAQFANMAHYIKEHAKR